MMNENDDDDDDDEEEIVLDRRNLLQKVNNNQISSSSGPILGGLQKFNIRRAQIVRSTPKEKQFLFIWICICFGMIMGIIGPTLFYLKDKKVLELEISIRLFSIKAFGFLLGTLLSFYLSRWFNVRFLLSLSCFSLCFVVFLLPLTNDVTSFYLISSILGLSLAVSYQSLNLYSKSFSIRSSVLFNRSLHLSIMIGAILVTLLLLPLSISSTAGLSRGRRDVTTVTSIRQLSLASTLSTKSNSTNPTSKKSKLLISTFKTKATSRTSISSKEATSRTSTPSKKVTNLSRLAKPSNTISSTDESPVNLFYVKIRSFLQSMTWIDVICLILSLQLFILGVIYSIMAIRGEELNTIKIFNPLALLIVQSSETTGTTHSDSSLIADRSSLIIILLLIVFFLILSGMESSCMYLAYLFARQQQFSVTKSLFLQCSYYLGRFFDISQSTLWIMMKRQWQFQSEYFSLKLSILLRLFLLCLIIVLFRFHSTDYLFYPIFFFFGYLLTSLSRLILHWIERDFISDRLFLQWIFVSILFSEMIFPLNLFSKLDEFISNYFIVASGLLILLYLILLNRTRQWQNNRLYRLLPTEMEMDNLDEDQSKMN